MLALGLTPFIYEPIRAAHFPTLNEGEPTACVDEDRSVVHLHELTKQRLMDNINREQYGEKLERGAPYTAQVGMWWLYFKWQWLRDRVQRAAGACRRFSRCSSSHSGLHRRLRPLDARDRRTFWYFGPLMFTLTLALIYYMNFKYGWSQSPELGDTVQREVRDRDYFYIWSYSAWGVWAALGLVYIWQSVAEMLDRDRRRNLDKAGYATQAVVAARDAVASHRVRAARRELADRVTSRRHVRGRLGQGHAQFGGAVRHPHHQRRQRHLPSLVRAGSRRRATGRARARHVVSQHRLVRAPDHSPAGARVRCGERSGDLSGETWPKPKGPPLKMTFAASGSHCRSTWRCASRRSSSSVNPGDDRTRH